MNLRDGIVIVTSLAPRDITVQRQSIVSWLDNGFRVVSLNSADEIKEIEKYFPEIVFIPIQRNAKEQFGKPYVYFDDVIDYFRNCDVQVCGIINSDIILQNISDDIIDIIYRESKDSMVYGSRLDIASLDRLADGIPYELGFDFFFFDRSILDVYPQSDFCIGLPWWDYWAIIIPLVHHIPVKRLRSSFAFHIIHPQNWNKEPWKYYSQQIAGHIGMKIPQSDEEVTSCAYSILEKLEEGSEEIYIYPSKRSRSVLIVYDNKGVKPEESLTYRSILNQTWSNKKVIQGNPYDFNPIGIEEDFIYFIKEAETIRSNFLEIMVLHIDDEYDYISCGMRIFTNKLLFKGNYMTHEEDKIDLSPLFRQCTLYNTKFLGNIRNQREPLRISNAGIVKVPLITMNFVDYLEDIIDPIRDKRIYIFSAGGHTESLLKWFDFSNVNIQGIIDNNMDLNGKRLNGYHIYHSNCIPKLEIDYILISSRTFEREIYAQLSRELDKEKLIRLYNGM